MVDVEHGAEHATAGTKNLLMHRIGPLPLWGWGLAAVGTFGAVWYLHSRASGGSSADSGAPAQAIAPSVDSTGGASGGADLSSITAAMQQQMQAMQQADQQAQQTMQAQFTQLQQQSQQAMQAQQAAMQNQFQQMQQADQQAMQQMQQAEQQAMQAQQSAMQQELQQITAAEQAAQSSLENQLSQAIAQMQQQAQAFAAQSLTWVKSINGGMVQVPSKVAQQGSRGGSYVAGNQPATANNPAGGGTWQGMNDQQIQSLFQATYGNNWQQVWQQQHNAQVAQNGG